ncbi:hypothetical protein AQUCO_08300100v1 [Aquilegia coerulea]|uniref:Leucine-rich repeat-containing N-terminal plant-type domain-containing protein n=1 Tax=Aquilegia coerulea TaxID=218851 RepID=A0A2G5C796_AQUCA|nr:hypothetical protein AQUCO_08300100v1 [Aquilegia coerulea]
MKCHYHNLHRGIHKAFPFITPHTIKPVFTKPKLVLLITLFHFFPFLFFFFFFLLSSTLTHCTLFNTTTTTTTTTVLNFKKKKSQEMGSWVLVFVPFVMLLITSTYIQQSISDPDDEACLTNLKDSLQDPTNSLKNWTKSIFAKPCSGFTSYLQGATCNNGRIYKLSLPNLSLRGSISPYLSNCTNLQSLDLSSNSLTGSIPSELQLLLNLAVLNLSSNRLSGSIPPQLALCAYLNVIDLHNNLLNGQIPQELGVLVRLSAFDVSSNRLSGPIPSSLGNRSGNLPKFNVTSFLGNKDLYGYPLPPPKSKGLSIMAIVGIGLGSGVLSLVLSFTAVCIWLKVTEQGVSAEEGKISQLMPDY